MKSHSPPTAGLLIAGTVPIKDFPLLLGKAEGEGDFLLVDGQRVPCTQGTAAMITAAAATLDYLNLDPPVALLAGDIGEGRGSRAIYDFLSRELRELSPKVFSLHYLLPIITPMKRVVSVAEGCDPKPILIADAGSMYAAKAAGLATKFDVFTPDAGEIAFLADREATHPAYIKRYLFEADSKEVPGLIRQAYGCGNAAQTLLVKGIVDYIARNGEILEMVREPDVPQMEAIGGTGDTITGLVSAFIQADLESHEAAIIAAKANRMAGKYASPTTATRITEIIARFPEVFEDHLCEWSGVCAVEPRLRPADGGVRRGRQA